MVAMDVISFASPRSVSGAHTLAAKPAFGTGFVLVPSPPEGERGRVRGRRSCGKLLRQKVCDANQRGGRGQRSYRRGRTEELDGAIDPTMRALHRRARLAMHLERTIDEVCDPVLPDASPSVQPPFDTVEPQARLGDLDDESSGRGVRANVVKRNTSHDG